MSKAWGALALAAAMSAGPALADTITYDATPTDHWVYGTTGNDTTGDTAVLRTDAGDELYLRWKEYNVGSPGSDANGVYHFTTGQLLNYDWGFDTSGSFPANMSAMTIAGSSLLTITNLTTGNSVQYKPSADSTNTYRDRNGQLNGSAQNSDRMNYGFLNGANGLGYNVNTPGSYRIRLDVDGLTGGSKTLSVDAIVSAVAVPEPATWGMLILGFGATGAMLRRRRASAALA